MEWPQLPTLHRIAMTDKNAGKYDRHYRLEHEIARLALEGEPGQLAWGTHDYEAMIFTGPRVKLIFYPHRTSAGNHHLRVRDQGSKDKKHARLLMDRLQIASGHWCTFQSRDGDFTKQTALADREGKAFGWAREIAMASNR